MVILVDAISVKAHVLGVDIATSTTVRDTALSGITFGLGAKVKF